MPQTMRRNLLEIRIEAVKTPHPASERIRTEQMPVNFGKNKVIAFYFYADLCKLRYFVTAKFVQGLSGWRLHDRKSRFLCPLSQDPCPAHISRCVQYSTCTCQNLYLPTSMRRFPLCEFQQKALYRWRCDIWAAPVARPCAPAMQ